MGTMLGPLRTQWITKEECPVSVGGTVTDSGGDQLCEPLKTPGGGSTEEGQDRSRRRDGRGAAGGSLD